MSAAQQGQPKKPPGFIQGQAQRQALPARHSKALSSARGSFLTNYFQIVLFLFGAVSLIINTQFLDIVDDQVSPIEDHLYNSIGGRVSQQMREHIAKQNRHNSFIPHRNIHTSHAAKAAIAAWNAKHPSLQSPLDPLRAEQKEESRKLDPSHKIGGLNCDRYGGPSPEAAQEMVYWEDIPSDSKYISPFKSDTETQYMTFEPDRGGWNNIRMSMETVLAMAFAMGRTLVLPPDQSMYLLRKNDNKQRRHFSFNHFFHMESISNEHVGFKIITMKEFLETVAMTGQMRDTVTGQVTFPPGNVTEWDGKNKDQIQQLDKWLQHSTRSTVWSPNDCMATFPRSKDPKDAQELWNDYNDVQANGGFPMFDKFVGKPNPVNSTAKIRMKENWGRRKTLCMYDEEMQKSKVVHFPVIAGRRNQEAEARLLVHFYAFLFFQDWRQDLWMKRFIRDHVRYVDEIQCAAARVVEAVRKRSKRNPKTPSPTGEFDSFHIRRGDFQYTVTRFDTPKIMQISQSKLVKGGTIYIATDERNKSFFDPMREHYDLVFLDDFKEELGDLNTNYFGMVDQLIASRGRTFFGCWFSTFTGYINRLRGYHADNLQLPGYEDGIINSYYYALADRFDHMRTFFPVKREFYAREFPTSWRLIDTGVGEVTDGRQ